MATFRPPITSYVPSAFVGKKATKGYFNYVRNEIGRGINVWITTANVVVTSQPLAADIRFTFLGGHSYELTGEQITLLTDAGYGDNIT